jgi:hypothetical protein
VKRSSDFAMNGFRFAVMALLFIGPALGQDFKRPDGSVPLPMDWSDQHVIYTVGFTFEQAEKMQGDPRYFVAARLHGKALADESAAYGYPTFSWTFDRESSADPDWRFPHEPDRESSVDPAWEPSPDPGWESPATPDWRFPHEPPRRSPIRRPGTPAFRQNELKKDWSVSLGPTAGVAAGQYPAKFTFDVTAAPSCTNDYVVFPVNAQTGFSRANVTGTFTGTASNNQTVTFTVTPNPGTAVVLTLTASTSSNTGMNFLVSSDTTTEALNLALAINRNLSATSAAAITAVASTNTVTVYTVRAGTLVTLSPTETLSNFSFGAVTAGANGTQANIVGFNNLYAGTSPFCTGMTFPKFIFSYASGFGPVSTSPVISLDGTKIAYIENGPSLGAILHVLTFKSGSTEYGTCSNTGTALPTCATAPKVPGTSGSTATAAAIPLLSALATAATPSATAVTATRSAPFVNYTTDTLYVGDDNGNLYSFTGVFLGTPTLAGSPFPVAVSPGNALNSPVVDVAGTGDIILGDSQSNVYSYSSAGVLLGSKSIGIGTNGGIWDGAIVDSTNKVVYFTTNCSGTGGGNGSALAQIPFTSTGLGTVVTSIDTNGEGCSTTAPLPAPQYGATPDHLYYTAGISSPSIASNGHILISYQGTGSVRLAEWGFTSVALNTNRLQDTNFHLTSTASSPSTEFYTSPVAYSPLSSLAQSGTTVTVTTAANTFISGQLVTIAGVAPGTGGCNSAAVTAINGPQTVTVSSATQFTFTSAVSATITGMTGNACTLTSSSATGPQDYVFFGTGDSNVFAFTLPMVANQNPTYTNSTSATGGTSGIIVDNNSTSGQASSLYFGAQTASKSQCGGTTTTPLFCAVKLTQIGLN